jgi:hypothetical protein
VSVDDVANQGSDVLDGTEYATHALFNSTANESRKPLDILLGMVRVHLIRRIPAHEMKNGKFASRMLVCPSCEVEHLIVVDDEIVSCDDALLECGPRDVRLAIRRGRRLALTCLLCLFDVDGSARVWHGGVANKKPQVMDGDEANSERS